MLLGTNRCANAIARQRRISIWHHHSNEQLRFKNRLKSSIWPNFWRVTMAARLILQTLVTMFKRIVKLLRLAIHENKKSVEGDKSDYRWRVLVAKCVHCRAQCAQFCIMFVKCDLVHVHMLRFDSNMYWWHGSPDQCTETNEHDRCIDAVDAHRTQKWTAYLSALSLNSVLRKCLLRCFFHSCMRLIRHREFTFLKSSKRTTRSQEVYNQYNLRQLWLSLERKASYMKESRRRPN